MWHSYIPLLLRVARAVSGLSLSLSLFLSQATHLYLSLSLSLSLSSGTFRNFTTSVYFSVPPLYSDFDSDSIKLAYLPRLRVSTYHYQPTTTKQQQNGSIHPLWYDSRSNR
jgi:hypothetical protein